MKKKTNKYTALCIMLVTTGLIDKTICSDRIIIGKKVY